MTSSCAGLHPSSHRTRRPPDDPDPELHRPVDELRVLAAVLWKRRSATLTIDVTRRTVYVPRTESAPVRRLTPIPYGRRRLEGVEPCSSPTGLRRARLHVLVLLRQLRMPKLQTEFRPGRVDRETSLGTPPSAAWLAPRQVPACSTPDCPGALLSGLTVFRPHPALTRCSCWSAAGCEHEASWNRHDPLRFDDEPNTRNLSIST